MAAQESDDGDRIGFKQDPEPTAIVINSLEKRSKSSKARVHYHKFTRGKDLSRYSATDMASILGQRPSSLVEKAVEVKEEVVEETSETEDHSHGVTTIPKGNLNDYFASKMAALREKQSRQQQEEQVTEVETTSERRVRFNEDLNEVKEFCSKEKIVVNGTDDPVIDGTSVKKNKKLKKNRQEQCLADEVGEAVLLEEAVPEPSEPVTEKKKKKKKAKSSGLEEEVTVAAGSVTTTEDAVDSSDLSKKEKRKKKKSAKKMELVDTPAPEVVHPEVVDESSEGKKNKKKKTKKADDAQQVEEETPTESPHQPEGGKKSKRKRSTISSSDLNVEAQLVEELPVETKKKKKKHSEVMVEETEQMETEPPKKKKKKSKKEEPEVENDANEKEKQAENIELGMQQYWLGKAIEEKASIVKIAKERAKESRKKNAYKDDITSKRQPALLGSNKDAVPLGSDRYSQLFADSSQFVGVRTEGLKAKLSGIDFALFKGANLHEIPGYSTMC